MANKDKPRGLSAVKMLNGGKIPMHAYTVATTTAIYRGDIVLLRAAGVVAATKTTNSGGNLCGVATHYAATGETVLVYDDPMTIFEAQSDSATDPGATTALGHIGSNCPIVLGSVNTTTKNSGMELDYTGIAVDTSDPLSIVGLYLGTDNDPALAHGRYLVMFNLHLFGYAGAKASI